MKIMNSDFIIRHLLPYFLSKDICWPSGLKGMIKTSNVLILYNYDFHPTPPWVVGISLLWGIMTWQVGRVEKYDYHSSKEGTEAFSLHKSFLELCFARPTWSPHKATKHEVGPWPIENDSTCFTCFGFFTPPEKMMNLDHNIAFWLTFLQLFLWRL